MPVAAAVSAHPVSSYATGEVIGQLLDALGPEPAVVLAAVTPGHAGALEDIAGTFRAVLRPAALVAFAASGAGLTGMPATAAAVAGLAVSGVAAAAWEGRSPTGSAALAVGARTLPPLDGPGPVLAVAVLGPVLADGGPPGPGPVGVTFADPAQWSVRGVLAVRYLGAPATVSEASGRSILAVGGVPALHWVTERLRDAVAVEDLPVVQAGLGVELPSGRVVPALGSVPAEHSLAVAEPVEPGTRIRLCYRDPSALGARLEATDLGAGGLVFTRPGSGSRLGSAAVPVPVLWCETTLVPGVAGGLDAADGDAHGGFFFPQ